MRNKLGFLFTLVLAFLVVIIQFSYSPISCQKDYQQYRENNANGIQHPILERYRQLTFIEEEESAVDYLSM